MALQVLGDGWVVYDGQVVYYPDLGAYHCSDVDDVLYFDSYKKLKAVLQTEGDAACDVDRRRVVVFPYFYFRKENNGRIWIDTLTVLWDSRIDGYGGHGIGLRMGETRNEALDRAIDGVNSK